MNPRSFDRSAFVDIFRQEAAEHVARASQGLLTLENDPSNRQVLTEVTRSIHTIKGGARMVALEELNRLAHKMEDVLTAARDQDLPLTPPLFDLLLETLDGLTQLLESPTAETASSIDLEGLCVSLEQAGSGGSFQTRKRIGSEARTRLAETPAAGEPLPVETAPPIQASSTETTSPVASHRPAEEETLRLAIRKLDDLANNVNEMMIMHGHAVAEVTQLRQVLNTVQGLHKVWSQLRVDLLSGFNQETRPPAALLEGVDQVDRVQRNLWEQLGHLSQSAGYRVDRTQAIVDELRQDVMDLQMVPVSTVFNTFQRSVRDLAREHGKQVNLTVEGETTELDRRIIERLRDPLIHMVRNSVDHGIELPDERERQGKSSEGSLKLRALHEGMRVFISLSDDGRGIDVDQVKEAALRRKCRTEEELAFMADEEAVQLVFEEGFSTKDEITDTSGRGVGMDVVKAVVEELDGDVHVETVRGQGTKMTLELPLTLALTRTVIVRAGGETFAIPSASIEDLMRVSPEDIASLGGREAVVWRDQTVSLVRLTDLLGHDQGRGVATGSLPVVVLHHGGYTIGFAVDEFLTEQEVVVKGLGQHLRRTPKVAGATILGTGELVLILHPPELIASARSGGAISHRRATAMVERVSESKRVLLVEDSFVTREMERSLLESCGLEVEVAVDGMEGFEKVLAGQYDLVVTDVEMPRMDGFELTARLRQREETRNLPILVVTSLEKEEHKRRGLEVGASAYIVKNAFDQRNLVDTIERLIGE